MSAHRLHTVVFASFLVLAAAGQALSGDTQVTTEYAVKLGKPSDVGYSQLREALSGASYDLSEYVGRQIGDHFRVLLCPVPAETEQACLSEINDARKNAGLDEFIAATTGEADKQLPQASSTQDTNLQSWDWQPVCNVLIPGGTAKKGAELQSGQAFKSGTYAFQKVDENTASCNAVVDKWKEAYTNFDELPPPYTEGKDLYNNQDNISLVAIYNPKEKATADCRVVTCTKTVKTTTTQGTVSPTSQAQEAVTKGSALICMTTPEVLSESIATAPFTEEQWGKIVSSIKGSASAVLPSLLGLAATVLGLMAVM